MREWWHAIGSYDRFKPRVVKWWQSRARRREIRAERTAYIEGLRDASRIMDQVRTVHWNDDVALSRDVIKSGLQRIHERSILIAPELNQ